MEPQTSPFSQGSDEAHVGAARVSEVQEDDAPARPMTRTAGRRSIVRTIRISEQTDRILAAEAENRTMSVNSLMSAILTKFAEWERFGEKTQRACVPLAQLRRLFETTPAETITSMSEEEIANYIEMAQFALGSSKLSALIDLLNLFGKHSGLWSLESEVQHDALTLRFYHELGKKYSEFLATSVAGALRKAGASEVQVFEDTHTVTTRVPFAGTKAPAPSTELFDTIPVRAGAHRDRQPEW